jgi:hypothetical protein
VIAAETAIRDWINTRPDLIGDLEIPGGGGEGPICRGAYLRSQRSPADGPYLIIARTSPGGAEPPLAEHEPRLGIARITAQAFAGTQQAAETAAVAYARAVAACTGNPEPCGATGLFILAHENLTGPVYVPAGASGGEQFCYAVVADFLLAQGPAPEPYADDEVIYR